jgi:hypothetical protein
MYDYDRSRVTAGLKAEWTEKGGKWITRAQYASGKVHTWTISESGDKFTAQVATPQGTYKRKKPFDSLEAAQRFGAKFIEKANGADLLKDVLEKDFTEK